MRLSREDRHILRLEKAQPLLEEIKSQIKVARSGALPKSMLAKACNYTPTLLDAANEKHVLTRWDKAQHILNIDRTDAATFVSLMTCLMNKQQSSACSVREPFFFNRPPA
jgi:hypothetical protein